MGSDDKKSGKGTRSAALAARRRLLQDLPVDERNVDLTGVATTFLEGGDGPPVVLLHGQGGSAVAWVPNIARLARSHRLVVPDLPGLGESAAIEEVVDGRRVAEWLQELIVKTCDAPPVVVGLSLGGTFAAHFAMNSQLESRKVVLVDSGSLGPFRPDPSVIFSLVRVSIRPTERNIERFFRHTVVDLAGLKRRLGDRWSDFLAYGRERNTNPSVKAANRNLLRQLGTKQIPRTDLAAIERKMALIWGREDKIMKVAIAEEISRDLDWPLRIIDGSGHAAAWDRPEAFANALEDLITS